MSPPTWRCGLKLLISFNKIFFTRHLPRGGVDWNIYIIIIIEGGQVTSHVEVWIETFDKDFDLLTHTSPPTWRCGLKRARCGLFTHYHMSPPTWRCGLKLNSVQSYKLLTSPPTWRCGLKLMLLLSSERGEKVTSHVEVWIETWFLRFNVINISHLPRGGVDWNLSAASCHPPTPVTSHVEVWIETFYWCR